MKISEQVRRIMKQSPLSAYRMGKLAGVAPAVLTRFLAEERTLTLDTLDAIAPVLGLAIQGDGRDKALAEDAPSAGRPPMPAKTPRKPKTTHGKAAPSHR